MNDMAMTNNNTSRSSSSNSNSKVSVRLEGIVWKRRSGLGQISETVGVGKSWERRRLVLLVNNAGNDTNRSRLCYYEDSSPSLSTRSSKYDHPRGTLDLILEHATVNATHFDEINMPTPYSLSIKTCSVVAGGTVGGDTTFWRFCFDDRRQQTAWLIALTDTIVDSTVRKINNQTMATAMEASSAPAVAVSSAAGAVAAMAFAAAAAVSDNSTDTATHSTNGGDGGGNTFHRLYEEGERGMFDVIKDKLLLNNNNKNDANNNNDATAKQDSSSDKSEKKVQKKNEKEIRDESGQDTAKAETTATTNKNVSGRASSSSPPKSSLTKSPTASDEGTTTKAPTRMKTTATATDLLRSFYCYAVAMLNISGLILVFYCETDDSNKDKGNISNTATMMTLIQQLVAISLSTRITWRKVIVITNLLLFGCFQHMLSSCDGAAAAAAASSTPTTSIITGAKLASHKEKTPPAKVRATAGLKTSAVGKDFTIEKEKESERTSKIDEGNKDDKEKNRHERWAMSDPTIDLSGNWKLVADDKFKAEYDVYLTNLGFGWAVRSVACSVIGRTEEIIQQSETGRSLLIKGVNPKGVWERTLIASGYPDFDTDFNNSKNNGTAIHSKHKQINIKTADAADVLAEAWWEKDGTVHRSWLKGDTKYGGGDHESKRYLIDDGKVYVCESIFHGNKTKAKITWRYVRA